MKKIYSLTLFILFLPSMAFAEDAIVALYNPQCRDYFIAQSRTGYAFIQWFGGYEPKQGDIISGDFTSFGLKSVKYPGQSESEKIVVRDYALSRIEALEQYLEKCKTNK